MSQADNKALALKRDAEAKQALIDQAESHQLQQQIRAEEKAAEVEAMLKSVPKELLREWRFQIALKLAGRADIMGNDKQIQFDDALLEAARYGITGKV